jgi:topoisomerase-4 subunit B
MSEVIIKKLGFPDNIIENVGMYLGSTKDFTTPLREIINNSTDELLNHYGNNLKIYSDKSVKIVVDSGRGLPYYSDPDDPESVITESILTETHTGSKFSNKNEKTGGLHGINV